MNNSAVYFFSLIFIGIGATFTMDIWSLFLKQLFGITASNFCLVGRWLLYMPEGIFRHSNIGSTPRKSTECTIGWIAHYMVGILFATVFIVFTGKDWLLHPTLLPAFVFGLITVSMPFFIMQPALGLGIVASNTANPAQARLRTLMNHTVFGVGIYLFGLAVSWLWKAP